MKQNPALCSCYNSKSDNKYSVKEYSSYICTLRKRTLWDAIKEKTVNYRGKAAMPDARGPHYLHSVIGPEVDTGKNNSSGINCGRNVPNFNGL